MFDIKYNVSILPNSPGIYIMKNDESEVLYVGKAKDLKKRVSQYFQKSQNHSEKTKALVKSICEFEYIVTKNEVEALILENSFIKKFQPKYNILLKDDKTYPYIKITINEDFPRIFSTKNYVKDGNLYFGPFTFLSGVNEIINSLRNVFLIRNCKIFIKEGKISCRPCMYYQIKKCNAPCYGLVSKKDYNNTINKVIEILSGKSKNEFIKSFEIKMREYSDNLEYEKALIIRDKIYNIESIFEKQKIFLGDCESEDYIGIYKGKQDACIQIFFSRDGKIVGRDHFIFENVYDETKENILSQFIKGFYGGTAQIPNVIYSIEFLDMENIREFISLNSKKRVVFKVPKKGDKKGLLDLVENNAKIMLEKFQTKKHFTMRKLDNSYLDELVNILKLNSELDRIEAYDISNISGVDSVGSMVVFNKGFPQKTQYRRFKIKNTKGINDYESMKEIIYRRFNRGLKEINEIKEFNLDYTKGKFCIFPDLILIDGGRGHVNSVEEILGKMNINIPVCGMVKDDRHRTRGLIYKNEELNISINSNVMKFITRVQDEVHRYAISYHRTLRDKKSIGSVLDEIPNIGNKRRRDLIMHFKSLDEIRNASFEELLKVPSMDKRSATSLIEFFNKVK